jgi:pyruvate formate lyase activating enzyme
LRVPFGYVSGLQSDPVEKKPFYHVYPGSSALTFGMLGCNLHCAFCQNWSTSQTLRDPNSQDSPHDCTAEQICQAAKNSGARLVVSSYNEPLITAEWASAVFDRAASEGIGSAIVSNGNASPEVLQFLAPRLTACKIDLKCFTEQGYRTLGCTLNAVKNSIRTVHDLGVWLEVVTLVVPGFNDSDAELQSMARFLVSSGHDIPWHRTAFHGSYRMSDTPSTPAETLARATRIGIEEGLRFVYAGNAPGKVGRHETTWCPECGAKLVERRGFVITNCQIKADGRCPACQIQIPGVWG